MFENMFTSLKLKTNKVSENLTYENLKNHTGRLSFDGFKDKFAKVSSYLAVSQVDADRENGVLPPRAYHNYQENAHLDLSWPKEPESEADNIVDKFIRVITINDESTYQPHRRTDREEIRRRLAMGPDPEDFYETKPGRKPSLHARLQSGMNLQICFMNETVSDGESPTSDSPDTPVTPRTPGLEAVSPVKPTQLDNHPYNSRPLSVNINENNTSQHNGNIKNGNAGRPGSLSIGPPAAPMTEADFFARQARLQVEARMALAQAKEMAHMQMEVERQEHHNSPVTEVVRNALQKVGVPSPEQHRRVSRRLLTGMNVAQLQVVVCELHGQIETLNEQLVRLLMERDELHMGQDSMLVDIEDLTRYLGAKEQTVRDQKKTIVSQPPRQQQQNKHTKLLRIPGITRK